MTGIEIYIYIRSVMKHAYICSVVHVAVLHCITHMYLQLCELDLFPTISACIFTYVLIVLHIIHTLTNIDNFQPFAKV